MANIKANPYVSNRVKEINSLTKDFQWSYVKTSDNPADLLTRGIDPHKLQSNYLWWHGPKDLINNKFCHTPADCSYPIVNHEPELSVNVYCIDPSVFDLFQKISDINKLQRVISYILRFKNNCLSQEKFSGSLMPKELYNGLSVVIRCIQRKYFHKDIESMIKGKPIKSGLANLYPYLDQTGVLRVGGRLQNAKNISFDKMHPAILPKSSHITHSIIRREHLRLLHAGPKLVLSSLSQRYWLISGTREVKKVVNKCIKCARLKAEASKQLMGSLPQDRLTANRPFQIVGVDFCGPFSIKIPRSRKPVLSKAYIALFVCFACKAIHVELVSDLTTEAFLACLKRFIARRGLPTHIYCDNAKTFKGASNQLKDLYELFSKKAHKNDIENFCSKSHITFKFIPSYSPEFGGLWEAGVKSVKSHLKRIVGNLSLTFEGLYTVITEIEAVLNSRPLLPMSSDISDCKYLTPGHFLIGTAMTSLPEIDYSYKDISKLKFWQILSKLKQDFWKAWSRDYLTQLQSRPKWLHPHNNLKVGDLVIVKNDNLSPLNWPMARIVKIFPGPDDKVRVAEVKMGNKIYTRSFRKLCPLPIDGQ
ncbi:uncharacterized protein LOC131849394 [Achroia grisella]|uniref:uncharacterized protein LOC131849394 n=1 Tax=Achroia grisella TaxID=688607 RepID=UPI0027D33C78|nr:uncharacterized protein LOC131849394 [Achroia grisella]